MTSTLWGAPATLPSLPGVQAIRDIAYVPGGDRAEVLDLYLPETKSDKPLPLIVWIHGGGWSAGSKLKMPALAYVPDGYAAASVEYRFSQVATFPAQIQDCQAAIRWLRAHAAEHNIDPHHIGVWGESAGGHLVSLLGTAGGQNAFAKVGGNDDQSDRVQAVVDQYGPVDFQTVMQQAKDDAVVRNNYKFNESDPYTKLMGVKFGVDASKEMAISPIHYVTADTPPFLILHGRRDAQVPYAQSTELAAALERAKVPVQLQTFPEAGHAGPPFALPAVRKLIEAFFDQTLKGSKQAVELLPPEALAVPTTRP